ncbi:MAG: SemiSWEET transporter [Methanobacteriota archaeon]
MEVTPIIGIIAGTLTTICFIPQLIKGYQTKKLDDVSYWMPAVLTFGMILWFLYGVLKTDIVIMVANAFGIFFCVLLMVMKKIYSRNTT